jgi:hypothetical protein
MKFIEDNSNGKLKAQFTHVKEYNGSSKEVLADIDE